MLAGAHGLGACLCAMQIFVYRSWPTRPNHDARLSTCQSVGMLTTVASMDDRDHATTSFDGKMYSEGPTMH